jgi:hypothetical protein
MACRCVLCDGHGQGCGRESVGSARGCRVVRVAGRSGRGSRSGSRGTGAVGAGLGRCVSDEPGDGGVMAGEVAVRPAREAGVDGGSRVARGSAPQVGGAGAEVGQVLLTAEQAGALLVVPGSWLRDKAAAGEVPCRRLGKHLRFSYADVDAIAAAAARPARVAPRPPTPRRGSRAESGF